MESIIRLISIRGDTRSLDYSSYVGVAENNAVVLPARTLPPPPQSP